jgi:two-component sensor histidine kinase
MYQHAGYHNLEKEVYQDNIYVLDSIKNPVTKSMYFMPQVDYLIDDGELDEAEKIALKLQSLNPDKEFEVIEHRANLILQQVQYHRDGTLDIEALKNIEEFFNKNPSWYLTFAQSKLYLARALISKGEEREAFNLMQKAYDRVSSTQDYRFQKNLVEAWIEMLEGSGQIAQSNKVLKYYQVIQDSIQVRMKRENFIELEKKYQSEKKEKEIRKLSYEAELNELALKKSNQQRLFFILAALALLVIAILVYRQFLVKRKAEALLSEKNNIISSALSDKELLLKEIHHRVKNNLQVVSSLLGLQSEYIKDDNALTAINEGRNRVRSMALIHQQLYSEENLTGINVKTYLETLIRGLFDTYDINEEKIQFQLEIEDLELDVDTVIPLGLIANELISNALKHAFTDQQDGMILVNLWEKDDAIHFSVKDNGKGMDTSLLNEEMESFGYQMILAFKEKLDAEINISGDNGTDVQLTIKNYQKPNTNG